MSCSLHILNASIKHQYQTLNLNSKVLYFDNKYDRILFYGFIMMRTIDIWILSLDNQELHLFFYHIWESQCYTSTWYHNLTKHYHTKSNQIQWNINKSNNESLTALCSSSITIRWIFKGRAELDSCLHSQ